MMTFPSAGDIAGSAGVAVPLLPSGSSSSGGDYTTMRRCGGVQADCGQAGSAVWKRKAEISDASFGRARRLAALHVLAGGISFASL